MLIKLKDDTTAFESLIDRFKQSTGEEFASKAVMRVLGDHERVTHERKMLKQAGIEKDNRILLLEKQLANSLAKNAKVKSALALLADFIKPTDEGDQSGQQP